MSRVATEKWTKLRERGRKQFVLRYGVLGWGVPTAILFTLLGGFQEGWDGVAVKGLIALVIFPLAGILWGRLMWAFFEWMNRREVEA
jgi:hypothetical protein